MCKQQLRKLKLYEMGISEWPYETSYEKMKAVVDQNLDGCEIKTTEKWPDCYFFMKGDRFVMDQDQKNDILWIIQDGFWSRFSNEFSLEYRDIQAIIKFLVEQHLKSKLGTPLKRLAPKTHLVEHHLKSKVGTPNHYSTSALICSGSFLEAVEQHLKSKVGTPYGSFLHHADEVEQPLKSKVGTPVHAEASSELEVEQHLK